MYSSLFKNAKDWHVWVIVALVVIGVTTVVKGVVAVAWSCAEHLQWIK
jgi:hypothetical protein